RQFEVRFFRDAIAKQIACKGSIKANHALSRAEIEALIEQLKRCDNPFTCPHGRPTMIRLSPTELEKMFERIQK
ncbi:MAG TPA: DNA mismatch repair protein MutL, partial [Candidatus Pelethenecus faecipullorum]|nr:DNA mismatch repair protein MutL [Candidatus Pelethenecus faecipullorum]